MMIEKALLEPFYHIMSVPGKEIRGQMIAAFDQWLHVPEDKLRIISRVVSMLHTASLLYVTTTHLRDTSGNLRLHPALMISKMTRSFVVAYQVGISAVGHQRCVNETVC